MAFPTEHPFKNKPHDEVMKIGKVTVYINYSKEKADIETAIRINREIMAMNS